jgi:hypothetical protein
MPATNQGQRRSNQKPDISKVRGAGCMDTWCWVVLRKAASRHAAHSNCIPVTATQATVASVLAMTHMEHPTALCVLKHTVLELCTALVPTILVYSDCCVELLGTTSVATQVLHRWQSRRAEGPCKGAGCMSVSVCNDRFPLVLITQQQGPTWTVHWCRVM